MSADQARQFGRMAEDVALGHREGSAELQRAMGHSDMSLRMHELIEELGYDPSNILKSFRRFYQAFFKFDCPDLSRLMVPPMQPGFNWVLPVVAIDPKMPVEAAFQGCKRNFPCWKYPAACLDETLLTNDRDARKGSYIIRLRDRIEADEELKNLSAHDLELRNVPGIVPYERLIQEGWYYVETGNHLDT